MIADFRMRNADLTTTTTTNDKQLATEVASPRYELRIEPFMEHFAERGY